jgi:tetratricopeptide (TPR) repeat protein
MKQLCHWALVAFFIVTAHAVAADADADARQKFLTGKYHEALDAYKSLASGDAVAAALGMARVYQATGRLDEAAKLVQEAQSRHKTSAALSAEAARIAYQRGDLKSASDDVATALRQDPKQLLARWLKAELARHAGRYDEALAKYKWLVDHYNATDELRDPDDLRWIGLAAAQYARWKRLADQYDFLVNELYPDALAIEKSYWPARYETGLLLLEKYNVGEAIAEFDAALAINPSAADVHAAKAQAELVKYHLARAKSSLERALAINPKLVHARQLKADLLLANFKLAEAATELEAAVALNPVSDETLGRLAAVYGVLNGTLAEPPSDLRMGKILAAVTKRNPTPGDFFAVLADTLDLLRRYPHAARYFDHARRVMPQRVDVAGKLGLVHMRLGEEVRAAELLKQSFADDPFNVRVKNTLAVLDVLAGYAVLETEHFVLKYDRGRDEILARSAARYLEEHVYPDLTKAFDFRPPGKTLIEIFNRAKNTDGHGWFSARMVGLPYIGTVAACAGKMIAMQSPGDATLADKFNWGHVLRHEYTHVINLQQTDFNIPHWFTESLAMRSEEAPRPASWGPILVSRHRQKKLFDLDSINFGFIRPTSGEDWTLAYFQASLYADFMVKKYGADAPARLLRAYSENHRTPAALARTFKVEPKEFEAGYREHLAATVSAITSRTEKAVPERDAKDCRQKAAEAIQKKDPQAALRWGWEAVHRDAADAASQRVLGEAYLAANRRDRAIEHLQFAIRLDSRDEAAKAALKRLNESTADKK